MSASTSEKPRWADEDTEQEDSAEDSYYISETEEAVPQGKHVQAHDAAPPPQHIPADEPSAEDSYYTSETEEAVPQGKHVQAHDAAPPP